MKIIEVVNHSICPQLIKAESLVVDLGANFGDFANAMNSQFGSKVYAVEASPSTFQQITAGENLSKHNLAVCSVSGPVELNVSSNPEASSLKHLNNAKYVERITIPGITLTDFLDREAILKVDLLKIDIEGAEIEVFNSCRDDFLRSIDQITVEFHEWAGVSSLVEVETIVGRLRRLGFFVFKQTRKDYSDVLFINRRCMSRLDYFITLICVWFPRMMHYLGRKLKIAKDGAGTGK
jgi:FkbM family methyltransferase